MHTRYSIQKSRILCLLILTAGLVNVLQASRIIIRAEASVDFVDAQSEADPGKLTSYHFVPGKFYGGYARDNSLRQVSFLEIAETIAGELKKQNYVPSGSVEENEVMILVNWGVTAVEDSMEEFLGIDSPEEYDQLFGSPSLTQTAEGETETTFEPEVSPNWAAVGKRNTAKMLGFWDVLQGNSLMPSDHYELQSLLNEERYFIIVTAFDNQKYQLGEVEVLWVTRFSMRAAGTPFDQAVIDMTTGAGDFFGQHMEGLERRRIENQSNVKVGDIEVIDTVGSDLEDKE